MAAEITVDKQDVARVLRNVARLLKVTLGTRRGVDLLEARSVELAPIDTGNLEAGFTVQFRTTTSKQVALFGFTPDYAAEVHELPANARGPRTQRKAGNMYGPAGPSYLLRAMRGTAGDGSLLEAIGRAYSEALND